MNKTICALFLIFAAASANVGFLENEVIINENIEDIKVGGVADCILSAAKLIGPLKNLVSDVKAKKNVNTLIEDLKAIFGNINSVCDSCGISKPKGRGGRPVDLQACAIDAANIAQDAADFIQNAKNPSKIISSLSKLIGKLPVALGHCGIKQ